MPLLVTLFVRLFALAAGLLLAASVLTVAAAGAVLWALAAGWARLTGRPVPLAGWRLRPGAFAWAGRMRPAAAAAAQPMRRRVRAGDVTDVEPK
jgi:hypothetical protein